VLRLLENLCISENEKIRCTPGMLQGGGRVVSVSRYSSGDSLGRYCAALQGWMGRVGGFPGMPAV